MTKEQIVEIVREKAKEYRQFDPNFAISIANTILASDKQSEEIYPREFVEWINWEDDRDDFHFIKDYTMNLWLNADEDMLGYNTDELFDYWQSKVKNEKK